MMLKSVATIHDKDGRNYQIKGIFEGNFLFRMSVYRLGEEVGYANCIQTQDDLMLADIYFVEDMERPPIKRIRAFLLREPKNYQQLGLGTAVLKFLIDYAKLEGISTLHGTITQEDINKNPQLIDWYQKHGFVREAPIAEELSDAVARVCLYLGSPSVS